MLTCNPFSLEGRTILITGASSGIGRGIAIACSKMGAQLVLNGRNKKRLEESFSMLLGSGHQIIASDLSLQDGIEHLSKRTPPLNGLVYSSGVLELCSNKTINRDILSRTMSINAFAPILLTSSLLKQRKINNNSSCVFVSSLSGVFIGGIGEIAYSASKGALSGYIKTAALELAPRSIRVNSVCPAIVQTELSKQYYSIIPEDKFVADIPQRYPLKRLGTPEDVANAVVYLLSDASSWVTGINLVIDGGLTLK